MFTLLSYRPLNPFSYIPTNYVRSPVNPVQPLVEPVQVTTPKPIDTLKILSEASLQFQNNNDYDEELEGYTPSSNDQFGSNDEEVENASIPDREDGATTNADRMFVSPTPPQQENIPPVAYQFNQLTAEGQDDTSCKVENPHKKVKLRG